MHSSALFVAVRSPEEADLGPHLPKLREAIRGNSKVTLHYSDAAGSPSERVVWPLALFFYSHVALLGGWCELRQDYRMFRSDRIRELEPTGERYDRRNGGVLEGLLRATGRRGAEDVPTTSVSDREAHARSHHEVGPGVRTQRAPAPGRTAPGFERTSGAGHYGRGLIETGSRAPTSSGRRELGTPAGAHPSWPGSMGE